MKVLLVYPPFTRSKDCPSSKTGAVLPPLGLLYLASYARREHPWCEIEILDSTVEGLDMRQFEASIQQNSPDVVGITIYTTTFLSSMEAVRIIKKNHPECVIIAGGAHASVMPEECLASGHVDIVVKGEGEEVFSRLLKCLKEDQAISGIPNIAFKKGNEVIHTDIAMRNVDLESIPFPARDLVPMKLYRPAKGGYRRLPATSIVTSRGCPFSCSFCSKGIFGSAYRAASAKRVMQEIELLIKDYGIREVLFNDDVFTMDRKRTEALCDLLIERKWDLDWFCSTRVNLVDKELLLKMKKAGCVSVGYGIESGDPAFIEKINKGVSLEKAKAAIRMTREAGIETRAFYILGFPGETKATINKTITTSIEHNADFVIYNMAMPFPSTEMYKDAKTRGDLLYDGLELYKRTDGSQPLVRIKDATPEELSVIYRSAFKKYYMRPMYFINRLRGIKSPADLARNASGLFSYLNWERQSGESGSGEK